MCVHRIHSEDMFADEYSHSTYTKKLVGALPKVKANMTQGIPQMIEIATSKRWKEDFDHKHKKRAGKGWFRYNTRFALPVTTESGEIVEYNTFQAVLIVRYSSDEKLYLYDIQNIKKKRDTHLGLQDQMVRNPLLLKMIIIRHKMNCKTKLMKIKKKRAACLNNKLLYGSKFRFFKNYCRAFRRRLSSV